MSANNPLNNIYADPNIAAINIKSFGGVALQNATDAFNHAVALITNANKNATLQGTIYCPPHTYTFLTSCTIPEGVKLYLEKGATLNIASGKTLTLNGGYTGYGKFAGSGTVTLKNIEEIDVRDFGVRLDDTSNTTYEAELQRAITAAAAVTYNSGTVTKGAIVRIPPGYIKVGGTLDFTGCSGVSLMGTNMHYGSGFWSNSTIKFTDSSIPGIALGTSNNTDVAIQYLTLAGPVSNVNQGASLSNHAIYGAVGGGAQLNHLNIHGWGGSAIRINTGLGQIYDVQATGCLWDYDDLAENTGVIHMGGGEPILDFLNINGTLPKTTTGGYISGKLASVYLAAGPVRVSRVVAAFSEVGFHFDGVGNSPSVISECRAEFNQGHGWVVTASDCHFTNCTAYDNGKSANNTYYGFYTDFTANPKFTLGNTYTNCNVAGENNANTNRQAGGFFEDNGGAANTYYYHNRYDSNCRIGTNMATGAVKFNWATTSFNIIPSTVSLDWEQQLSGVTALSFFGDQGNNWRATINANTATEITATNLIPGQVYRLLIINHSGGPTITLNSTVFPKVTGFTSPAASKYLTCQFLCTIISDTPRLVQLGNWSGDM